jgi:hypothetical protein
VGAPGSPTVPRRGAPRIRSTRGALALQLSSEKFKVTRRGAEELAPSVGSQPPSRWARGPLLVPYKPGTPAYRLQIKTRSRTCIHALPCVLQLRTSPPADVGSGATTCPAAPNLTSVSRWALALPHVLYLRASPPSQGGLRHCYVSHGSGSRLPTRVGSGAASCLMTLCGPWVSDIKKGLAGLTMRLGLRVSMACLHVFETPDT